MLLLKLIMEVQLQPVPLVGKLTKINTDLTVLLKRFQQYLDAEVNSMFQFAINHRLEDLCYIKEQQQQHLLALSTETESFVRKMLFCYQEQLTIKGQIMDFLEKKFEKKLNQKSNKDGKFWYEKCLLPFFSYPF